MKEIRMPEGFSSPRIEPLLYSPKEVTIRMSISRSKVYELIRSGELKSIKIGTAIRVSDGALREFIEERAAV